MASRKLALVLCVFWLGLALIIGQPAIQAAPAREPVPHSLQQATDCKVILTLALETLRETCQDTRRNEACYGNEEVEAEPVGAQPLQFADRGDRVAIQLVRALRTSPLDMQAGTWGISLLKLQARLPDTLPGQNVTFLVYGNTAVQNASGDMQAFYFTSGLGAPACREAPADGIIIRSPKHTEVAFTVNGVKVSIASTVILSAQAGQALTVHLVEGRARVSTADGSQTLSAEQMVSVPLGGPSGLEAIGPPSAPVAAPVDPAFAALLALAEQFADPDAAVNVSISGCIRRVEDAFVLIYDYLVARDAGVPLLQGVRVGECLSIRGILSQLATGEPVVIPVSVERPAVSVPASGDAAGGGGEPPPIPSGPAKGGANDPDPGGSGGG